MAAKIALCVDSLTCAHPEEIGLAGERLDAQTWLSLEESGEAARDNLREEPGIEEVWVASCDDVEPINLAATLKADQPERTVRLLSQDLGGSLLSRATTASIDEVMNQRAFVARYNLAKSLAQGPTAIRGASAPRATYADTPGYAPGATYEDKPGYAPEANLAHVSSPASHTDVASEPIAHAGARSALYPDASEHTLTTPVSVTVVSAPQRQGNAFLLPVVSGSGGAGKSTVSLLAAWCAHAAGYKTLLLDYDLQFGDVAVMAGVESPLTIDEALMRPDKVEREADVGTRPALIAAPPRLEMAEGIVQAMPEFLHGLSQSFDVIVANTGAAWAEQHAVLLERSSAVAFLVDQRSSSVRACRHALELCARCGIATGQFQFVLNRCAKNAPLSPADVSCALKDAAVAELADGGRDVEDYLAAGAVDELFDSGNGLCTSVRDFIGQLLPSPDGSPASADDAPGRKRQIGKRRGRHVGRRKGWGK